MTKANEVVMSHPICGRSVTIWSRLGFCLLLESILLGLSLSLYLIPPVTVQASPQTPKPVTTIQASSSITVYLPVIIRSATFEEQLLNLINAERSSRSLATLSADNLLMQVAEAHSQDMVNRNFFSHINPDGLDPGDRLDQAGYQASTWGETIGAGYTTPTAMFNGWMNSADHRTILLSPTFTEIGLGYVAGGAYGHYWTAVFAKTQ
jgi:uncharacterized protein YkwD